MVSIFKRLIIELLTEYSYTPKLQLNDTMPAY
ncbi:MAG: hypothetical protein JWQ79_225 [Mucilaginibacter sp.]|nr:hypothetical protein [Mucilaginibacter sp.]